MPQSPGLEASAGDRHAVHRAPPVAGAPARDRSDAQGQLARDQLGSAVDELIEISRTRSEELRNVISSEVQRHRWSWRRRSSCTAS